MMSRRLLAYLPCLFPQIVQVRQYLHWFLVRRQTMEKKNDKFKNNINFLTGNVDCRNDYVIHSVFNIEHRE